MIGLVLVLAFILVNAALAPLIAVCGGQTVKEWWKS